MASHGYNLRPRGGLGAPTTNSTIEKMKQSGKDIARNNDIVSAAGAKSPERMNYALRTQKAFGAPMQSRTSARSADPVLQKLRAEAKMNLYEAQTAVNEGELAFDLELASGDESLIAYLNAEEPFTRTLLRQRLAQIYIEDRRAMLVEADNPGVTHFDEIVRNKRSDFMLRREIADESGLDVVTDAQLTSEEKWTDEMRNILLRHRDSQEALDDRLEITDVGTRAETGTAPQEEIEITPLRRGNNPQADVLGLDPNTPDRNIRPPPEAPGAGAAPPPAPVTEGSPQIPSPPALEPQTPRRGPPTSTIPQTARRSFPETKSAQAIEQEAEVQAADLDTAHATFLANQETKAALAQNDLESQSVAYNNAGGPVARELKYGGWTAEEEDVGPIPDARDLPSAGRARAARGDGEIRGFRQMDNGDNDLVPDDRPSRAGRYRPSRGVNSRSSRAANRVARARRLNPNRPNLGPPSRVEAPTLPVPADTDAVPAVESEVQGAGAELAEAEAETEIVLGSTAEADAAAIAATGGTGGAFFVGLMAVQLGVSLEQMQARFAHEAGMRANISAAISVRNTVMAGSNVFTAHHDMGPSRFSGVDYREGERISREDEEEEEKLSERLKKRNALISNHLALGTPLKKGLFAEARNKSTSKEAFDKYLRGSKPNTMGIERNRYKFQRPPVGKPAPMPKHMHLVNPLAHTQLMQQLRPESLNVPNAGGWLAKELQQREDWELNKGRFPKTVIEDLTKMQNLHRGNKAAFSFRKRLDVNMPPVPSFQTRKTKRVAVKSAAARPPDSVIREHQRWQREARVAHGGGANIQKHGRYRPAEQGQHPTLDRPSAAAEHAQATANWGNDHGGSRTATSANVPHPQDPYSAKNTSEAAALRNAGDPRRGSQGQDPGINVPLEENHPAPTTLENKVAVQGAEALDAADLRQLNRESESAEVDMIAAAHQALDPKSHLEQKKRKKNTRRSKLVRALDSLSYDVGYTPSVSDHDKGYFLEGVKISALLGNERLPQEWKLPLKTLLVQKRHLHDGTMPAKGTRAWRSLNTIVNQYHGRKRGGYSGREENPMPTKKHMYRTDISTHQKPTAAHGNRALGQIEENRKPVGEGPDPAVEPRRVHQNLTNLTS